MATAPFSYPLVIREQHLDSFGHVNNAAYLVLFEEARWEFITQNGYGLAQVQEWQKGPVILELNLRFKKEVKLRDQVTIVTHPAHLERKMTKLKQEMLLEGGTVAAELDLIFGLFDLQARKLIDATPEWKRALGLTD